MATGLTRSEEFVAWLCHRAFLKLWTHPNPVGKKGKELCDCLVVCGIHVVIISVKEIEYRDTGDKVGWERWHKTAIEKSVQQIWGAERWLRTADCFRRSDGREIALPPGDERQYHRISVSLGGRGEVPLKWGDFGNGFVHVLDQHSLTEAFRELDTITDFVTYLSAADSLFERGVKLVFSGSGAEDLLALYVRNGPTFGVVKEDGAVPDTVVITGGIWKALVASPEYIKRNKDLESSYAWHKLIDHYADDLLTDGMFGDSNHREFRSRELALRCLIVRGRCKNVTTVVGIATDKPRKGKTGYSSDILYLHVPLWTEENSAQVDGIQRDLGYFKNTKWSS